VGGRRAAAHLPPTTKTKFGGRDFEETMTSEVLGDLLFALNQPLQSSEVFYSGMLKYIIKTYEYVEFFFFG
jgi:hypothetical protein